MRAEDGKKKTGCCGVITAVLLAIAVFALITVIRDILTNEGSSLNTALTGETVRELLGDYVDPDARVLFAEYDMIEEEIERALRNQERQICVVGRFTSSEGYVNDPAAGLHYDSGTFRMMPYSTFWLKSYEAYSGTLSSVRLIGEPAEEHCYVYTFEYYGLNDDEIRNMETLIDQEADDIISCIPAGADCWQKCRIIHDELIRRTEYDHEFGDHCHDLYGALVSHRAVCEGYALAFRYILNRAGEDCNVVAGSWDESSEAVSHAWNQITAPTYERYIDVTWDDTGNTDSSGEPVVSYDYFGLTEEEISAVDQHDFSPDMDLFFEEPEAFNYYRHEGYLLSVYDTWSVTEMFLRQYEAGSSGLTVRFDNASAYQEACAGLFDGGGMNEVMNYLGYYGQYRYSTNEAVHTITVGF